jgi:hypothetical protein
MSKRNVVQIRPPSEKWVAYSGLEPDICDADRLATVLRVAFLDGIAGPSIEISDDQYNTMMETLLDRLCELTGKIKEDYYAAAGR